MVCRHGESGGEALARRGPLMIDRILDWLHPDYGLVKDGVLLTYDEAVEAFREEYSGDENQKCESWLGTLDERVNEIGKKVPM